MPRPTRNRRSHSKPRTLAVGTLAAGLAVATLPSVATAADLLMPGDAVVTGFSGIAPVQGSPGTFGIDLSGPSAQVLSLAAMARGLDGSVATVPAKRRITAAEVGQVFPVTLAERGTGRAPDVFLGATSQFGIHIVEGVGNERLESGEAGARFMSGQVGPDGSAGSIWRIDGATGEITQFAELPENAGPGVGDVSYDGKTRQLFASDLDSGLVHRIGADGTLIDTFDHGVAGRPAEGLAAVADDGSQMDIEKPAFVTADPETWGMTQPERRVWALAVHDGRLYYAVGQEVWSVGLEDDGGFDGDVQREIEVDGLSGEGPITDMLFDRDGRIYLAQRGKSKPAFDFSEFAEPGQSNVVRYKPVPAGGWEHDPETYAIGVPPSHDASNGGIALGYAYDDDGQAQPSQCGGVLWTTGERLASSDETGATPADVHGLQANPVGLVRPQNEPPTTAAFVDYDGMLGDPEKAGHMGDVEVFAPCLPSAGTLIPTGTQLPPGFLPPDVTPPDELPPEFPPPGEPFRANLQLTKRATQRECSAWGGGYVCNFVVRVRNTGPDRYFGDIQVRDTLPAAPAGAIFGVGPVPPWACWGGAASIQCWRPNVLLDPGQSVSLNVNVWLPGSYDRCRLRNTAEIEWAPGGTQWNTDPTDDSDGASAHVPLPRCTPVHRPVGSVVHRPQGSIVHRPIGSDVHRPLGSDVHRPLGSDVHRPLGSDVHRPHGSIIHRPIGSDVHRPLGSDVHRPKGSIIHRPIGSDVHRPLGSDVHRPKGSIIHRPIGSDVHRPHGSIVHRPAGSVIHLPKGSDVHRPHGSIVHRPKGSVIHLPKGSIVHLPRGSKVHRPKGSIVHRPIGSKIHRPRGSVIHLPKGSSIHLPRGSKIHRPIGSKIHRPLGSNVHRPIGSKINVPRIRVPRPVIRQPIPVIRRPALNLKRN